MLIIETGLKISLIVKSILDGDSELNDLGVVVGCFTNCRESGLTFKMFVGKNSFTWCIYEHRNSDSIIINGKEGYISSNGDLPYMAEDKYTYIKSFNFGEYEETANFLKSEIITFHRNSKE